MIDSQLLERFVTRNDPSAFQDLVQRHGPAVLRACRRHLNDHGEAEDALQATFLILLRRAPSIRDPERLGRWLVGVAKRVALRSRRQGTLRSQREVRWAATRPESLEPETPLDEVRRVVREELNLLPDSYRLPLALCYLEGLTHEEAANRLGWPVGTVKVRLVRGRRQLRDRLDRRGLALGVAFLLLLLRRDASASLATGPFDATAEAMTLAAKGDIAALEAGFPRALDLARKVGQLGEKARWATSLLVLLAFLIGSSGGVALAFRAGTIRADAAQASARLLKVLEVNCR
jgi:RNA polymerase sigma factor (sigma-70 family)